MQKVEAYTKISAKINQWKANIRQRKINEVNIF